MTKWDTVKLGALASFRNGLNYTSADRGAGLAIVGVSDFQDRIFVHYESLEELAPAALNSPESLIQPGDILFVRSNGNRDLIGRSLFVAENPPLPTSHSGFTIRVRFHDSRADPLFFAYYLRSAAVRQQLSNQGGGTSINNLNQGILSRLDVPLPLLETQRRIASILGAYDDLIEVNRRRIKVLEEMARGLFESFVQKCAIEGLPGLPLDRFVSSSLGGDWGEETPTGDQIVPVRVIRGTDFDRLKFGDFSSCPLRYIKKASAEKRLLRPYDVVLENSINAKTRPAGSTLLVTEGLLHELGGSVIAASFCRVFTFPRPDLAIAFHLFCKKIHQNREIEKFQIVAANGIANFQTSTFLRDAKIPVDREIVENNSMLLQSITSTLYAEQIGKLAASRDLLLPRLISGQLSVEAAEQMNEAAE